MGSQGGSPQGHGQEKLCLRRHMQNFLRRLGAASLCRMEESMSNLISSSTGTTSPQRMLVSDGTQHAVPKHTVNLFHSSRFP